MDYLTRDDWNSFPKAIENLSATDEMKELMVGASYVKPEDAPDTAELSFGQDAGLKLIDMMDVPYGDAKWKSFIDQLSIGNLATVCGDNRGVVAIPEVGKPANASTNGPSGIQGSYMKGNGKACTLYVDEPIQAAR